MTVYFRPNGTLSRGPVLRGGADEAIVARVAAATGLEISRHPDVDYEDWMEPVAMLDAAISAGLEIAVLPPIPLRQAVLEPVVSISGDPCRDMVIGRRQRSDPYEAQFFDLGWPAANDRMADHYAELSAFRERAGRRCALADMYGDDELADKRESPFGTWHGGNRLGEVMADFAPGEVLIKHVYPAKSLSLLAYDLPGGVTADEAERMFLGDTELHFARFEGDPAALLVQERIEMRRETRVFVVGGEIVAGAACIESDTPAQAREAFPTQWQMMRNGSEMDDRSPAEREATAMRMRDFALKAVAAISAEAPDLVGYTLDIATGKDDAPLIIEINPIGNAGLYGVPAAPLFEAYRAAAEAAPHRAPAAWDGDAVEESENAACDNSAFGDFIMKGREEWARRMAEADEDFFDETPEPG